MTERSCRENPSILVMYTNWRKLRGLARSLLAQSALGWVEIEHWRPLRVRTRDNALMSGKNERGKMSENISRNIREPRKKVPNALTVGTFQFSGVDPPQKLGQSVAK